MNPTNQKGLLTELHCQLAFSEIGITLSAPITSDCRYDYIADIDGQLTRIQCKTCTVAPDKSYIKFAARSTRSSLKESFQRYYTKDEIDYFYTYYNNQSYLVPVEQTSAEKTLRFWTKNNQNNNISWAKNYEFLTILANDFDYIPKTQEITIEKPIDYSKNNHCKICGKLISDKAVLCLDCNNKDSRIVDRPNRIELKNLIRTTPFIQIGKMYGVSDNTIRKWCKSENLPSKKTDIRKYTDIEWEEV